MAETAKRDWEKIVADSNGDSRFLPDAMIPIAKEWQAKRKVFDKEVNRLAKMENEIGVLFTSMVHEIRKYIENIDGEEIWSMDIGFDSEALKEGLFIITTTKNK